ncbi:MAG: hypothetical protein HYS17_08645 [Micavibrio aeruginosavorus]|uniref:Uncharacterized protein n=1 Tax=Micavibrio aeruginosavorus TaxID=349221 RepID=A0A7T5UH39_9BACT|nr:MAG: hypothetical protein HYS17_08645 [Micavibrio aeruginosavorus]
MRKIFLAGILIAAYLTAPAFADDDAIKKYRDYTPQQLADLPEKVRSSDVPMMYLFAMQNGLGEGSELLFAMYLNLLMYPGVNDYDAAVKAFQKDLGDEPTGVLTVWQIYNMEQRAEMQKLGTVLFPQNFSSYITKDTAQVEGTTTILEDRIAYPINHVKVTCYKADNYCEYSMIVLMTPEQDSWSQTYQIMDMGTDLYKITRWESDEVDAVPMNEGTCRVNSLNFNFKTKEFFEIARNTEGDCEFLGATLEKLPKPRISQIVDGEKIILKEFSDLRKKAFEVTASDFQKKANKYIEAAEAQAEKAKVEAAKKDKKSQ